MHEYAHSNPCSAQGALLTLLSSEWCHCRQHKTWAVRHGRWAWAPKKWKDVSIVRSSREICMCFHQTIVFYRGEDGRASNPGAWGAPAFACAFGFRFSSWAELGIAFYSLYLGDSRWAFTIRINLEQMTNFCCCEFQYVPKKMQGSSLPTKVHGLSASADAAGEASAAPAVPVPWHDNCRFYVISGAVQGHFVAWKLWAFIWLCELWCWMMLIGTWKKLEWIALFCLVAPWYRAVAHCIL